MYVTGPSLGFHPDRYLHCGQDYWSYVIQYENDLTADIGNHHWAPARNFLSYQGYKSPMFYDIYGPATAFMVRGQARRNNIRFKVLTNKWHGPHNVSADERIFGSAKHCGNSQHDSMSKTALRHILKETTAALFPDNSEKDLSLFKEHQLLSRATFDHQFNYIMDDGGQSILVSIIRLSIPDAFCL